MMLTINICVALMMAMVLIIAYKKPFGRNRALEFIFVWMFVMLVLGGAAYIEGGHK